MFVNPSKPSEVVGLFDWQSSELCPLYFHARRLHFLDYDGHQLDGVERPQRSSNTNSSSQESEKEDEFLYIQQSLCSLYSTFVHKQNPELYAALEDQSTTAYTLLLLVRNILIDGEANYLAQAAELESTWSEFQGSNNTAYPLHFSKS